MPGSSADRVIKQERLSSVRRSIGGKPLALTSHEAISWYLEGARTHVSLAGAPVLAVLASDKGDVILAPDAEKERLIAEELLPEDGTRVVGLDWATPPSAAPLLNGAVAEHQVAGALRAARASLLPAEMQRYRELSEHVAAAVTGVAKSVTSATTEREATARLGFTLLRHGIDPLVLLASGAERLAYRHPLPTDAPLGPRAMLVVCARKHGLITNLTRWVTSEDEPEAQRRILAVESAYWGATMPGAVLSDVLAAGAAAYAAHGFEADEWRRHHQGGPAGYAGRDPRATETTPDVLQVNQAFAWNPTAFGVKSEDTVLVTPTGLDVLTRDSRWPTVSVDGRLRPAAWRMDA